MLNFSMFHYYNVKWLSKKPHYRNIYTKSSDILNYIMMSYKK